jgi:hypothetical protein
MVVGARWDAEQVHALCPVPSRLAAARGLAVADRWSSLGASAQAVWGRYHGASSEPYEVTVDHVHVASRCTCPARARPCKHVLALLLLWVQGDVADVADGCEPPGVAGWLARHQSAAESGEAPLPGVSRAPHAASTGRPDSTVPRRGRDERVARLGPALAELDRWITDRVRTGLADPALARYATWDTLAARLVDGQAGGLANRVRRLGGQVGVRPGWHEHVLAELGVLHLLAEGGQRLADLPPELGDGVAVALGWQVRQADVLAGVPERDTWLVAGRSDTAEDRIVVRRSWLWGTSSARWALVLGFAAHGQALDEHLAVGTTIEADLFRYPGAVALRALIGHVHVPARPAGDLHDRLPAGSIGQLCDEVGEALAVEPWLERHPAVVRCRVTRGGSGAHAPWVIADGSGSLALHPDAGSVADLVACTADDDAVLVVEWTALGILPVAVHLPGRSVDLGPRLEQPGRWR